MKKQDKSIRKKKSIMVIGMLTLSLIVLSACNNNSKSSNGDKAVDSSAVVDTAVGATNTPPSSTKEADSSQSLNPDSLVLKVGDIQVTYREIYIYMLQLKDKYEPSLGKDIWSFDLGEEGTFDEYAKQEVLDQVTQLKIVSQHAKELGITLTNDELLEIDESVADYMTGITDQDKTKYGITQDMVKQVLSDNYLMEKVFSIATNEVNTDITDEEAKQIKIWQIEVMTLGEDKNQNQIDMNEAQKIDALERAQTLLSQVKEQEDFYSFAKANTDATDIEITFGKGDKEEAYENAAFTLKKDQLSDVIQTDSGYYILYCVSEFDEDATAAKKESIIKERQDKTFSDQYKEWSEKIKVTENIEVWSQITFATMSN